MDYLSALAADPTFFQALVAFGWPYLVFGEYRMFFIWCVLWFFGWSAQEQLEVGGLAVLVVLVYSIQQGIKMLTVASEDKSDGR